MRSKQIIVGVCVTQVCWRFVWPKIGNCALVAGFLSLGSRLFCPLALHCLPFWPFRYHNSPAV
jgi:hypothetical protein